MSLDGSRRTIFVEGAFCYSGEYINHGICSILGLTFTPFQNISSVGEENSTKESVDQIHLPNYVDEVKKIANEIFDGISIVLMKGFCYISYDL